MRKSQCQQPGVAPAAVREFAVGPGQETLAQGLEEFTQRLRAASLVQRRRLLLRADVEVDQRDGQRRQVELLAQQVAVDLGLGPVQLAVVVWHPVDVAAVGLDLFEQQQLRVIAVGTTPNAELAVFAAQRQLGAVRRPAPSGDGLMACDALLRSRRWREAQVEVALFGSELAQRSHRDAVAGVAHRRTGHAAIKHSLSSYHLHPPARLTCQPSAFKLTITRSQWSPCSSTTPSLTVPPEPQAVLSR